MTDSPIWRVNRTPRFTVFEIGEYMVSDDGPRETMRRNMKYERIAPTVLYRDLQKSIVSFLASPVRDRKILNRCRALLETERDEAINPQKRENAIYALRSLDAFERSLNQLPITGLNLSPSPKFRPLDISGVKVSIQPTSIVRVKRPRGADLIGALLVDPAKGIEPKSDAAKEKATLAMTHSAYLLHELVTNSVSVDGEKPSPEHCMVFHTHRQELVRCPTNYRRMLRNMEAACRDISLMWHRIEEPNKFDPSRATYRS